MDKLSQEEREKWHHLIAEKLQDKYDYDLVNKKLDECENGWKSCPKDLTQRIEVKFFKKPPSNAKELINFEDGDDPVRRPGAGA